MMTSDTLTCSTHVMPESEKFKKDIDKIYQWLSVHGRNKLARTTNNFSVLINLQPLNQQYVNRLNRLK